MARRLPDEYQIPVKQLDLFRDTRPLHGYDHEPSPLWLIAVVLVLTLCIDAAVITTVINVLGARA